MTQYQTIRFKLLRNGTEYGELFAGDNVPTLRMDCRGEIKMSLQGTFLPGAVDTKGKETEIDWMADEIKPVLIIDGIETPLGVLMPSTVEPTKEKERETVNIQAYDRCWKVRDTKVEGSIHLSAGTSYMDSIEGLLTSSGISSIMKKDTNAVLAEDREDWQTGTSYLTIINELLAEINYKQLWFNNAGYAMLEPASQPTVENIQHIFTNKKKDPRNQKEVEAINLIPRISRKTDVYQAPNVFICICSNADKAAAMSAKAENTNPQSPLSIMRRGRRIVEVVNVNNIEDQTALQAYANRLLFESMTTGETINVETLLLPGFGVEDVTAIRYDDEIGICVEKAWTMQLGVGGLMSHEMEKVVVNIG